MSSNQKLLRAWKNLDFVLNKDNEEKDELSSSFDYKGPTKGAQSVKNSHVSIRPQSSYLIRNRPLSSTKSVAKGPMMMATTTSSFFATKAAPFQSPKGLAQMFSPKTKYFDEATVLHSVSVADLSKIYERRCVDTKNDFNPNQLNHFIDKFNKNCRKKIFDMEDQYIGPNAAIEIANLLATNSHFIKLNLSRNSISDIGANYLAAALHQNSTIIHLDLANNGITHEGTAGIFEMLAENETIISLRLNSYEGLNRNRIDHRGMKPLATALEQNEVIQFLDLSGSSITTDGLGYLCQGLEYNRSLASLNIADNDLGPKCQPLVKALIASNIIELDISNNKIGDSGLQSLFGIFPQNGLQGTRLQTLNLAKNNLTPLSTTKLFEILTKNTYIKKLILDHNHLTGRGISNIVTLLWENSTLNHISLYDCELNYEGADAIGAGLARNFHIETLILGKNPFRDEGIKILTNSLKENSIIRVIDFSACKIREEGGKLLAEVISTNHNITKVDLKDNHIYDEAGLAMADAAKQNKKLIKLNLERNPVSYKYILDIQKSLKSNSQTITKAAAASFVVEMDHLKAFEAQKFVVAQEGRISNAKQKELNDELAYHNQVLDEFKEEEAQKMEELEDEYATILDEVRQLERQRYKLEETVQQARADADSKLHFTNFTIENNKNECEIFTREIKKLKESMEQQKANYERQIAKLKVDVSDRERIVNVQENTVNTTENQLNKIKEDRGGKSPKSPQRGRMSGMRDEIVMKSPANKGKLMDRSPKKSFAAFTKDDEASGGGLSTRRSIAEVVKSPEKVIKPVKAQAKTPGKTNNKANPKIGK